MQRMCVEGLERTLTGAGTGNLRLENAKLVVTPMFRKNGHNSTPSEILSSHAASQLTLPRPKSNAIFALARSNPTLPATSYPNPTQQPTKPTLNSQPNAPQILQNPRKHTKPNSQKREKSPTIDDTALVRRASASTMHEGRNLRALRLRTASSGLSRGGHALYREERLRLRAKQLVEMERDAAAMQKGAHRHAIAKTWSVG